MSSGRESVPLRISGYRIQKKLGQGGMSTVYLATQRRLDREVALKVLSPDRAADQELRARFLREGKLAGRINHTNVVTYHELREVQGWLFMALEYVDGGDLADLLRQRGKPLPERLALGIARDVACGLEACARAGVVHRDIKPHNIFLTADMIPKVADFSASQPSAAALQAADIDRKAGLIIGSPSYMAPEQAAATRHVDARADLYGLGATLFFLLTGQAPYRADSPRETLKRVAKEPVPDPQDLVKSSLARGTRELVRQAMAKTADERFQTARDMVAAIERVLHADGTAEVVPQGLPQEQQVSGSETGEMERFAWSEF